MKINTKLMDIYLKGGDLEEYKELWYFKQISQGTNSFTAPPSDKDFKAAVKEIGGIVLKASLNFTPANVKIWDTLFPDWRETLENVCVDLILGLPAPYDALVCHDDYDIAHVIFNLSCWTQYLTLPNIEQAISGLYTHELFHVLTEKALPAVKSGCSSPDYLTQLNACTFNEAFAHLVSYQNKDIQAVDWHSGIFENIRQKSRERLICALNEQDEAKRAQNMEEAFCGKYDEKFACMCGMLYLADLWEKGGIKALKDCFFEGCADFALKAAKAACQE